MNKKTLKEYRIWKAMKARCYAPSNRNMGHYQDRGIQVCEEWRHNFDAFMRDMGPIPGPEYSIDRIDPYKDYTPDNCRWLTMKDQQKNRSNCRYFTYNNRTECLKEWARIFGVKYTTLYMAITRDGRSFEEAVLKYSKEEAQND